MITLILSAQNPCKLALSILHLMPLIDDNVLPIIFVQFLPIFQNKVIGSNADIPSCIFHSFENLCSCGRVSTIHNPLDRWSPFIKLSHPVWDCWEWHHDQERPIVFLELDQISKKGNCLNGFTKTHFVSENTIELIVVERNKPLKSLQLIILQFPSWKDSRLLVNFFFDCMC